MTNDDDRRIAELLKMVFAPEEIDELGKQTGQSQRLRIITPFRLMLALLQGLGEGRAETIADLCRAFNYAFDTRVAYKAFYNRLARPGFAEFTREMVSRLLTQFAVKVLEPRQGSALARFTDIVVQDGTSFAVKPSLRDVFPGRFTTVEPAAVELHATLSGFHDELDEVSLSPDTTQEREFLPSPDTLRGKLLLGDRGYPSRDYFSALDAGGASFIMRISRSFKPLVQAVHRGGRVKRLATPVPLSTYLNRLRRSTFDLDVDLGKADDGKNRVVARILVLPGEEKSEIRLCTNLPREDFPLDLVARLYRLRWQVELVFKEWKSYANLRKFDTGNPHIAEGLIWASLAAAILKRFLGHAAQLARATAISTRKVAMCAPLFLPLLLDALARRRRLLEVLTHIFDFLEHQARRADLKRDVRRGRQSGGLELCGVPS